MEQAQEPQGLLDWLSDKYKEFGADLEFVSNRCVFRALPEECELNSGTYVGRRRDRSLSRDSEVSVASFATRSTSSRSQRRSRERCAPPLLARANRADSTLGTGRGRVHVGR